MHHYPHHIGDYRSATAHLSNDEDLAYRKLLEMYYDREQPIPSDTQWVARRLRVGIDVVEAVLGDFFVEGDDGWRNHRCDDEIAKYHQMAERNRANGAKGGRRKNPVGSQSQPRATPGPSQPEPRTENQEPENQVPPKPPKGGARKARAVPRPDDIPEQAWEDWKEVRKAKRAGPITATVMSKMATEAKEAGITMAEAVEECASRGWQGFRAEWLANSFGKGGAKTPPTGNRGHMPHNGFDKKDYSETGMDD